MNCPSCATEVRDGTEACPECGWLVAMVPAADEAFAEAYQGQEAYGQETAAQQPARPAPAAGGANQVRPAGPVAKSGKLKQALHRLQFHGTGGQLFGIQIVNLFLTVLTVGIYGAWGKVKLRKWMYSQMEFKGERFAYHGTGKEVFIGHLKLVGLYVAAIAAMMALTFVLKTIGLDGGTAATLSSFALEIGIVCLIPLAIIGSRRYALSRSSYQGIRFSFRGQSLEFAKIFVPQAILVPLTLGIWMPVFQARLKQYLISHSYYGNQAFSYTGDGKALRTSFFLNMLATPFCLGLNWAWYAAKKAEYDMAHTRFGAVRFKSTLTGGTMLKFQLISTLAILCTGGLATPWMIIKGINLGLAHTRIFGDLDLTAIRQDARSGSAVGDALGDALDVDLGIAF